MQQHKQPIQTLQELQLAINTSKKNIKESEANLYKLLEQFPKAVIKATVVATIPALLNHSIAKQGYRLAFGLIKQLFTNTDKSITKQLLVNALKHIGIATFIKTAFKLVAKS
ncbi:MAG: hypothetical protein ACOVNY_07505 [Chitinophagaceae bacterium]